MASAAPAWPQAALQRLEVLEPTPFVPQRLGLDLLEAPKPPTARPRVGAAACALPEAPLVGAEAERSQQIALRAPDQIAAHARWARQPLFEREPPRKASRGSSPRHGLVFSLRHHRSLSVRHHRAPFFSSPPGLTRWSMLNGRVQCGPMIILRSPMDHRVKPGGDRVFSLSRCPFASELCPRQEKPSQGHSQEVSSLKRREAERREAHQPEPHRQAMRRAPSLLSSHCGRTEAQDLALDLKKWSGRARLSAPHRGIRGFFGLGSAQAALPGTTGCKREDPLRHQCSEHLAVRHLPDGTMPKPPVSAVYRRAQREPLPLRPKEYPRERRPFASGILLGNRYGDACQERRLFIGDAS